MKNKTCGECKHYIAMSRCILHSQFVHDDDCCDYYAPRPQPITNGDKIRQMSNEGLPDWCQVGKWVWYPKYQEVYGIELVHGDWRYVTEISQSGIKTHMYIEEVTFAECNETRVRPWKFEEAPLGVKCRNKLTNGSLFVAYLNQTGDGYRVIDSETDVDFNTMATTYIQYDYKPCGVLQHRDEIGQWTSDVNGWRRYRNLSGERTLIKPYDE